MKTYPMINKLLLFMSLLMLCLTSCKEEDTAFVLRSTDVMEFPYEASDQAFTICTNGSWKVESEDSWITVSPASGTGNGESRENVTVQVTRNAGLARTGTISMQAAGKDLQITVVQKEGFLIFDAPYLSESLVKGKPIEDASILIPYSRAIGDESIQISCSLSGASVGIDVPRKQVPLSGEKGIIEVPLSGTPGEDGELIFTLSASGVESTIAPLVTTVAAENIRIYLEETFDLLVLGGDHVAKKVGKELDTSQTPWVKDANNKNILPDNPVYKTTNTPNTDGTSDLFNTMGAAFREIRGISDWAGLRVYERPGYVKISTKSSTDGKLVTPALSAISGTENVSVSFSAAKWNEDAGFAIRIEIEGTGTASPAEILLDHDDWRTKEFVITGASAATKIVFKAGEGEQKRFCLDNIKVTSR